MDLTIESPGEMNPANSEVMISAAAQMTVPLQQSRFQLLSGCLQPDPCSGLCAGGIRNLTAVASRPAGIPDW